MSEKLPFRRVSLGYQVNHLARVFEAALRTQIAPFGVAPGQFPALLCLFEEDGLTQAEMCSRVQIAQPTMAHTLRRMERDGLVTRTPVPEDGRSSRTWLTDHAREIEDDLVRIGRGINASAVTGLSEAEVEALLTSISVMIDNLTPPEGAR
ncbi:MarR family winged helix-turn-helix transcriptional regulator [Myceligenerans salitolerans]|uniref:Winged helix-turn-helix transcriptional regulator n=1 Tax=Myceligenerans salitolerans TaxID=1230528 RepID=A0ABS3IEC7_9MICO|nr:MarR family winged helix-turn-helix transcriptional regulator [Myceligenerans salitolerans]MBO0610367.1 winged helix-turn-helix transcriptional regulator [Myceligenerans salitolerans]